MRLSSMGILLPCLLTLSSLAHCTWHHNDPHFQLNLYTGVPDVVRLGDSEAEVLAHTELKAKSMELPVRAPTDDKTPYTSAVALGETGIRAFFRNGRVCLIQLSAPFKGPIQAKKLQIFSFPPPPGLTWDAAITRDFGTPELKAFTGHLGSEMYFYAWGDITFNRIGPREINLYRDGDIAAYRQKNYDKNIQLFTN